MKRVIGIILSIFLMVSLCIPATCEVKAAHVSSGANTTVDNLTAESKLSYSWGNYYYNLNVSLTNNANRVQVDRYKVTLTFNRDDMTFPWGKPAYTEISGNQVVIDYSQTSNSIVPGGAVKALVSGQTMQCSSDDLKLESIAIEVNSTSTIQSTHDYETFQGIGNPKHQDDAEAGLADSDVITYVSWATVQYGNYPTDKDGGTAPIEWRVLNYNESTNQLLLISDKVLDTMAYGFGNTTWESSSVRAWLNSDFIETAFDSDPNNPLSGALLSGGTYVDNTVAGEKSTGGNATPDDKVWLPSTADMENSAYCFIGKSTRKAVASDYLLNKSTLLKTNKNTWVSYFLRTPGYYQYDVAGVDAYGKLIKNGWRTYTKTAGIRPMILLDNTKANVNLYGQVNAQESGKYTFTSQSLSKNSLQKLPAVGTTKTLNKVTYTVTKSTAKTKTVAVTSTGKKATKVVIPSTVTINGSKYKVTAIKANAFKKSKKLKTIQIQSTNLNTMNKKAFNGLDENTTVKIVKSKYKKYKKMIKNTSVTVKKMAK